MAPATSRRSAGLISSLERAAGTVPPLMANTSLSARIETLRRVSRGWSEPASDISERRPWLIILWVVVMTLLQVMRQESGLLWDTLWAEDAGVFLSQAVGEPFLDPLLDAHASYIQLAPRLVTGVAAALPLEHAAAVIAVGSALVVSLLSVFVYFASSVVFRSQWARVVLATLVVLAPTTTYETTATAANLHWYLLFACFWTLLAPVRSWVWVGAGGAIALVATLSDPLAALLAPLALLQAVRSEGWAERAVPIVFAVGLTVQVALGPLQESPQPFGEVQPGDLLGIYSLRVAGSLLVGDRFLDELWRQLGWVFAWSSLAVVVVAVGYGIASGAGRQRFHLGITLFYSAAFLAVPLLLRGTAHLLQREEFTLNGSRYMVVPVLFLAVAILLVVEQPGAWFSPAAARGLQMGFVLWTLALVLLNYSGDSVRGGAPGWRASLAHARSYCATPSVGGDAEVEIGRGPEDVFPFRTTCQRIQ